MLKNLHIFNKESENTEVNLKKEAIVYFVNSIFHQQHIKKQLVLFRILSKLVFSKHIEAKFASEYILQILLRGITQPQATHLHQINTVYTWCKAIEYVKKFIPINDYKSCRDVFKNFLEIIKHLSQKSPNSTLPSTLRQAQFSSSIPTDNLIDILYEVIFSNLIY